MPRPGTDRHTKKKADARYGPGSHLKYPTIKLQQRTIDLLYRIREHDLDRLYEAHIKGVSDDGGGQMTKEEFYSGFGNRLPMTEVVHRMALARAKQIGLEIP